jgi:hypothetical protein
MDKCGTEEGHLVIFNRDKNVAWDEKIFEKEKKYNGKKIKIWGM